MTRSTRTLTCHPRASRGSGPTSICKRKANSSAYFRLNMSTHGLDGALHIPVAVFKNGTGPRILMLGGVHGDEFEGQVMAMKLMRSLDIENVQGQIIIMSAATRRPPTRAARPRPSTRAI